MKTILITICLLLTSQFASAQWTQVFTGVNENLKSVFFPSSKVGYVVGYKNGGKNNGIILKTNDGGVNWSKIDTTSKFLFQNVTFFNEDTGIVVGQEEILRTLDGGQTWRKDTIDSLRINDLYLNINVFYLLGQKTANGPAHIYTSTNYGDTWNLIYKADTFYFGKLNFIDSLIGYASVGQGGGLDFDRIYKTVDAGYTWQEIDFPQQGSTVQKDIYFVDTLLGFSAGYYSAHLMKSTDGGSSWQKLKIDNGKMPLSYFISRYDSVIYAGSGKVFRSNDLGATWQEQQLLANRRFAINDIFILDADTAVALGDNGAILRTSNGGITVGIQEKQNFKKKLKVYPNPTKGILNLEKQANLNIQQLYLIDISGKVVRHFNQKQLQLDVSGLASGNYLLQVVSKEGQFAKKVVLE